MATLLYRFNDPNAFPLLEGETTARSSVTVRSEGKAAEAHLRIAWSRHASDPPEVTAVIALPLLAVGGNPGQLLLDVWGDASCCRLSLEAADTRGWGFAYSLGSVDFTGWRTCSVDVQEPSEYWGERKKDGTPGIVPPMQPYRLRVTMSESCEAVDVGFGALSVTGDVRPHRPGIALPVIP